MDESGDVDAATSPPYIERGSTNRIIRRCTMCGVWKAQGEFHNSRTGQFSYCGNCRRAYDRQYYQTRGRDARLARERKRVKASRAWMASLKDGVPCADCGQTFPSFVMHWDHLPGFEKVGSISEMVENRPRTLVLEELKKCELVCANCHVLRTMDRAGRSAAW